jgi:hypothetical protein
MVQTARTNPTTFFAVCTRLIPNDVRVTVEQQLPGNLSIEDWAIMREIIAAVRQAIRMLARSRLPNSWMISLADFTTEWP